MGRLSLMALHARALARGRKHGCLERISHTLVLALLCVHRQVKWRMAAIPLLLSLDEWMAEQDLIPRTRSALMACEAAAALA